MILYEISFFSNLSSIATLMTAIATLATVLLMFYERKARIIVSIEPLEKIYFLKIENVGKSTAKNIKIHINNEYIKTLYNKQWRDILVRIQSRKFHLCAGKVKYYPIVHCYSSYDKGIYTKEIINNWHNNNKYKIMRIVVEYNGWHYLEEELCIDNFDSEAALIPTPDIKQIRELSAIKKILRKGIYGKVTNEKP